MFLLKKLNKTALSSNDDINLIESYAYRTSKCLVSEKEDIKCSNIIRRYKID